MYVRVLQNVVSRERICIASFADAPQVLIPMDGIPHVQLKNKHSASSKHPMDGILRALWRRCHPMDGKMKTTSSALTDQPRLCYRKHRILPHHPCFRAMINLQPCIRRLRCSSSLANGTPAAPTADSKRNTLLLHSSDPSANFFAHPSARPFPFLLDFDLRETFFCRPPSRVLFFGRLQYRPFFFGRLQHTVWPSGDIYHNLHIFSSGIILFGPYSPLQKIFVMGAYCFLFPCGIFFCVYSFDP